MGTICKEELIWFPQYTGQALHRSKKYGEHIESMKFTQLDLIYREYSRHPKRQVEPLTSAIRLMLVGGLSRK